MRFNIGRMNVTVALLCSAFLVAVTQPVKGVVVERQVLGNETTKISDDDAEQHLGNNAAGIPGGMEGLPEDGANSSSDLELGTNVPPPVGVVGTDGQGQQLVGVRWLDVTIPKNVTITKAYVQFWVNEEDKDIVYSELDGTIISQPQMDLRITGELNSNPATYGYDPYDITNRTDTTTAVDWINIPRWGYFDENNVGHGRGNAGLDQRTPDLSSIIQELIDQPGWTKGRPMALMLAPLSPNEYTNRTANSWETKDKNAAGLNQSPLLHVEYVPEPASLAMMAIGLLGLLAARRTRV